MSKVNAVVLAGAVADPEMNPGGDPISRAMVRIGNKTMLQWVVDALRGSGRIGKIIAVGDVNADGIDEVLEPGDSLVSNLQKGVKAAGTVDPVLVVSADIPLLTPTAVEDFINRALALDVDMAYPVIPRADCERCHPELQRTYLKTGDGTFTGGNVMLMKPEFLSRNWGVITDAYMARKQIFKLARMIGMGVLVRVIVGQVLPSVLRLSILESAVSRMLNGNVRAVISSYSEIGEDVDKPSDLAAVRNIFAAGNMD